MITPSFLLGEENKYKSMRITYEDKDVKDKSGVRIKRSQPLPDPTEVNKLLIISSVLGGSY